MSIITFGENVDLYDRAIKFGKEYGIINARIKPVKEEFRKGDNNYEMEFLDSTIIRPVFQSLEDDSGDPDYVPIDAVQRIANLTDRHDLLASVLYVRPLRTVKLPGRSVDVRDVPVREVIITDASVINIGPFIISVWDDLATAKCEEIASLADPLPIIGFTALKNSEHKAFSFATSVSTSIIIGPHSVKAKELAKWMESHAKTLDNLSIMSMMCVDQHMRQL